MAEEIVVRPLVVPKLYRWVERFDASYQEDVEIPARDYKELYRFEKLPYDIEIFFETYIGDDPHLKFRCFLDAELICRPEGVWRDLLHGLDIMEYNGQCWCHRWNPTEEEYGLQCVIPKRVPAGKTFSFRIYNHEDQPKTIKKFWLRWKWIVPLGE